ncbi:MAG: site-specific DNA-methyltransferase [Candidatus Lokiarchaeota archaeon]|nr:site-specific DNA-methyltransferase [Candidatus Lokiarchaeota archaeon]
MGTAARQPGSIFFQDGKAGITIVNDDFITTPLVEDESIDLLVTSPPYNVDIAYGNYKDDISYKQYLEFTRAWLGKAYSVLKDDGRACFNIPLDKNKGGQQSVYADFITIAKNIGFQYHATIIWNEQNISRRTAWGSWLSASAPYVIAPVEVIPVMYKKVWKKEVKGESDVTRDEFLEYTNAFWTFNGESAKRIGHPAPFPLELPRRCIRMFSYVGDTVLDPFLGSGTTIVACAQNKRKGVGVDISPEYCQLARDRVAQEGSDAPVIQLTKPATPPGKKRKAPRQDTGEKTDG